jgi:hypothetical protein
MTLVLTARYGYRESCHWFCKEISSSGEVEPTTSDVPIKKLGIWQVANVRRYVLMGSKKFIAWTAFSMFVLVVALAVVTVFAPTLSELGLRMSVMVTWVIGLFALLSIILGLVSFETPQGKIATIGGALFFLAVLIITPYFTLTS